MRVTHRPNRSELGAHVRSQELEDERTTKPCSRPSNELPLGTLDVSPMAGAHNRGKVTRFGPPTDPKLDAHRDNDRRTRWERLTPADRRLVVGGIVFVLGLYAVATLGPAIVRWAIG